MRVLLDTHAFLWWITDDPRLSRRAHEIITNIENDLFLSAASGWEIAIKAQIGRLVLPDEPADFIFEQLRINAIKALPMQMIHAIGVFTLPTHHRDPFDRLLVAQAQFEGPPILTDDPTIKKYEVDVIW